MKWQVALKHDPRTRRAEVDIYDVVGDPWMGTTAFAMLYQLRSLDVDDLLVRVNSVGGSVTDGMDIYNLLREHPAKSKVCRVSGCAASIATVIALACPVVEMHENSQWMVHESRASFDFGAPVMLASDLARMAEVLTKTNGQMMAIYALKTGKELTELADVCKAETWFTAQEALEFGFVDRVIGLADQASMMVSASAWTPAVIGKLHSFPAPLLAVARAAQRPPAAEPTIEEPPPADPAADEEADMKSILNKSDFLKSVGALTASLVTLQTDLAKMGEGITAVNVEAKSKDLEKLSEEVKEMSSRAKKAEEEVAKMSESAAEYEDSKARAEKAEADLEDLKKKLAKLKGEEEVDAEGNPFGDDDEEDDDEEAKAALKLMSRAELRRIARVAMGVTGNKGKGVAGSLLALGASKPVTDAKAVHKSRVEALLSKGRITPAMKGMAMRMTGDELDVYEAKLGTGKVGPVSETFTPDEPQARETQRVTAEADVTLTDDEKKQCKISGVAEDRYLAQKRKDLLARGAIRSN